MTGAEYRHERLRRDLTQVAAAEAVGVAQATISDRENGKKAINKEAELAIKSLPLPETNNQPSNQ